MFFDWTGNKSVSCGTNNWKLDSNNAPFWSFEAVAEVSELHHKPTDKLGPGALKRRWLEVLCAQVHAILRSLFPYLLIIIFFVEWPSTVHNNNRGTFHGTIRVQILRMFCLNNNSEEGGLRIHCLWFGGQWRKSTCYCFDFWRAVHVTRGRTSLHCLGPRHSPNKTRSILRPSAHSTHNRSLIHHRPLFIRALFTHSSFLKS